MNILHLSNHCIFGNGNVHAAVDLACAQARAGDKVFYASSGGDFEDLLRANNVHHEKIVQSPKKPLALLRSGARLVELIRREKIDVVHAHMMSGAIVGRLAASLAGAPLITTVHNAFDKHAILMGLGDRVIAVSEAVKRNMIARGVKASKVVAVLNGTLNVARRQDEAENGAVLEGRAITTICGLHDRKGLPTLIEAFGLVSERVADAHLYIIGEGPHEARYKESAERLAHAGRIHFMGQLRKTKPYLKASDIFVLASLQDPCPLVIPEAREMGCAIVASHVDGIPEMLAVGDCGLTFKPGDANGLAKVLQDLLENPSILAEQRATSLRGIEYFDINRVRSDTEKVYRSVARR